MRIDLLTLFPDMCETVMAESIVGRARKKGALQVCCHQIRDYARDKHHSVDDTLFGGGMGMLLLALLEGRDMYGYEMIEALRARSNEVFRLKAGTLYPLLHSLEAQGWVTSSDGVANGRTRRYYAITRDGRAALAEQQAGWYAYADAVRGVLEGGNPCGA